jgi:glycosidase
MGKSQQLKLSIIGSVLAVLTACSGGKTDTPAADYLTRDIKDDVFYFVMPDRFENGDPDNDMGSKTVEISRGGFDPTSKGHYHGGDLRGLINKLDYLQEMGITAIWLTPIMRNQAVQGDSSGYHGYWILDFTEIDPHFGTNEELKELIDSAHAKGMKVFFDIITNHTADVIKYEECHRNSEQKFSTSSALCEYVSLAYKAAGKGYTPYVEEHEKHLKTPAWLNDSKYYHNQGDSKWFGENSIYGDFAGLDDLDTDNPEVVDGFIKIYSDVIAEFKPDGFRIDTVKHVNTEFWQKFTPAIIDFAKEQGIPNFFVFGEVYSEDARELSKFTTEADIPSVLDFHIQKGIKNVFARGQGTNELTKVFELDHLYNDHNSSVDELMNFISNHDMGRFVYYMEQAFPEVTESEKLKRTELANAMMYFTRGIPVVYYGDEQGFVGEGGDRGAREDMMPSKVELYNNFDLLGTDKTTADENFDTDHPLYIMYKDFARVYQANEALRRGKQVVLASSDNPGIFAFSRTTEKQNLVLVFNSDTNPQSIDNKALNGSKHIYGVGNLAGSTLTLPPLSFAIFQN